MTGPTPRGRGRGRTRGRAPRSHRTAPIRARGTHHVHPDALWDQPSRYAEPPPAPIGVHTPDSDDDAVDIETAARKPIHPDTMDGRRVLPDDAHAVHPTANFANLSAAAARTPLWARLAGPRAAIWEVLALGGSGWTKELERAAVEEVEMQLAAGKAGRRTGRVDDRPGKDSVLEATGEHDVVGKVGGLVQDLSLSGNDSVDGGGGNIPQSDAESGSVDEDEFDKWLDSA